MVIRKSAARAFRGGADVEKRAPMAIGYARVSTEDQNLDSQTRALKLHGCDHIVTDKISGSKRDRPGLARVLKELAEGDTLVVWKIDRLGRSLQHLIQIVDELGRRGVHFVSLTNNIDTTTPQGRFVFHLMGALAEMEREQIRERTRAGLAAARAKGNVGGRPNAVTPEKLARARDLIDAGGLGVAAAAKAIGVGRTTLYRALAATQSPAR